ncbi:MAG: glycosyltransferase family 39 protein [Candidatus Kapabacteria bacterium]|nr:glycosyltransferase family 39 protein [Candidatus Kapabacteria bacterium]
MNIKSTYEWIMSDEKRKFTFFILALYFFNVIIKIIFSFFIPGPEILGDEVYYKDLAWAFYHLDVYKIKIAKVPYVYPFLLAPAFLFGDNFHIAMYVINAFLSSLLVFPVWLLSRMFLERKYAILPAIISTFLPYHYTFPQTVMTENLFFPMFVMTVYAFFKARNELKEKWVVLFGVLLGLSLITRDQGFAILPAFFLIWWLPNEEKSPHPIKTFGSRIWLFVLATCIAIIAFFPQVLMKASGDIIEFVSRKASGAPIQVKTMTGAIQYNPYEFRGIIIAIYSFYLILSIAPFIFSVLLKPFISFRSFLRKRENVYLLFIIIMTGLFMFVILRAAYFPNYLENYYLQARYTFYTGIFWLIYAFIAIQKFSELELDKKKLIIRLVIASILSLGIILVSYFGLIKGEIWKLSNFFVLRFNALDAYIYKQHWFLIIYASLTVIIISYLIYKNQRKAIYYLFAVSIPLYLFAYIYAFGDLAAKHGKPEWGLGYIPGKKLYQAYKDKIPYGNRIIVYNGISWCSDVYLYFILGFWANNGEYPHRIDIRSKDDLYSRFTQILNNVFLRKQLGLWFVTENMVPIEIRNLYDPFIILGEGLYITEIREDSVLATQKPNLLKEYSTQNYNIYKIPFDLTRVRTDETTKASEIFKINSIFPDTIKVPKDSVSFYIYIKTENHNDNTLVVINETTVKTINTNYTKDYLIATFPSNFLKRRKSNRYEIRLYDNRENIKSEPVYLYVKW